MEFTRKKLRIGDVLIRHGIINEEQLNLALEAQKGTKMKLGEALIEIGVVTDEQIAKALSEQLHLDIIDLSNVVVPEDILKLIPAEVLQKHKVIPFEYHKTNPNILRVAMSNPIDMYATDDIEIITNLQVEPVVATTKSIDIALDQYFGSRSEVNDALEEYTKEKENELLEQEDMYSDDVNNSPIVQLVKTIIEKAALQRASDIHIEPMERQLRVRYRIDGTLYEKYTYSVKLLPAISARVKIIGGMDISEKRKPQDGRITQQVGRQEFDIRVSILPTIHGEKIVMRLAAKNALSRNKSELGFSPEEMERFDYILSNPHGILLVTGPTGSGKSTTLYTALSELNTEYVNIITVEDPVEANIDGINQVHVNPKAELTFASALRSILRQDPDIIMIGEIRDGETAGIAVQASITGHMVVSTLHTNSAASTITRLADMGIAPYLIADSIVGVIAQRLVRRLCPECKEMAIATADELELLGLEPGTEQIVYKPCGCPKCDNIGYKGRIGVYEIMNMTPDLKRIIARGGSADEIKDGALKDGMSTLRMSATRYVLNGITSVSEMAKVSFEL